MISSQPKKYKKKSDTKKIRKDKKTKYEKKRQRKSISRKYQCKKIGTNLLTRTAQLAARWRWQAIRIH